MDQCESVTRCPCLDPLVAHGSVSQDQALAAHALADAIDRLTADQFTEPGCQAYDQVADVTLPVLGEREPYLLGIHNDHIAGRVR